MEEQSNKRGWRTRLPPPCVSSVRDLSPLRACPGGPRASCRRSADPWIKGSATHSPLGWARGQPCRLQAVQVRLAPAAPSLSSPASKQFKGVLDQVYQIVMVLDCFLVLAEVNAEIRTHRQAYWNMDKQF